MLSLISSIKVATVNPGNSCLTTTMDKTDNWPVIALFTA